MESKINALDWWREQPFGKWLNIYDIPNSIFWTIWNNEIEKGKVKLHDTESKYKKYKYNVC